MDVQASSPPAGKSGHGPEVDSGVSDELVGSRTAVVDPDCNGNEETNVSISLASMEIKVAVEGTGREVETESGVLTPLSSSNPSSDSEEEEKAEEVSDLSRFPVAAARSPSDPSCTDSPTSIHSATSIGVSMPVSSPTSDHSPSAPSAPPLEEKVDSDYLIEYACLFGLDDSSFKTTGIEDGDTYMTRVLTGNLLQRIPDRDTPGRELPPGLELFVFPAGIRLSDRPLPTRFHSFVLTMLDGSRLYAFCITVSSQTTSKRLGMIKMQEAVMMMQTETERALPTMVFEPKAICIISKYPFHRKFKRVMQDLVLSQGMTVSEMSFSSSPEDGSEASLLNSSRFGDKMSPSTLEALYARLHVLSPAPGERGVTVRNSSSTHGHSSRGEFATEFSLPLPGSMPLSDVDYRVLFQMLEPRHIITVINALMCEVSVVLTSCNANILTPCLETILALMYPMKWPYIYITLMPSSLNDIFDAIQPFFIGTLSETLSEPPWPTSAVVVDLDNNVINIPQDVPFERIPWQLSWRLFHTIQDYFNIFQFEHLDLPLNPPDNLPANALVGKSEVLTGGRKSVLGFFPAGLVARGVIRMISKHKGDSDRRKENHGMTLKTMNALYSGPEDSSTEEDVAEEFGGLASRVSSPMQPGSPDAVGGPSIVVDGRSLSASSSPIGGMRRLQPPMQGSQLALDALSSGSRGHAISGDYSEDDLVSNSSGGISIHRQESDQSIFSTEDAEHKAEDDAAVPYMLTSVDDIGLISQTQLDDLCYRMHSEMELTSSVCMLKHYSNVFIGMRAVTWLIQSKAAKNEACAIALGERMISSGDIAPVRGDNVFKDGKEEYYFPKEPYNIPSHLRRLSEDDVMHLSRYDLNFLARIMLEHLNITTHSYRLKRYEDCFVGSEAVEWLMEAKIAKSVAAAVGIGYRLVQLGYVNHVTNDHDFKNEYLFYRFGKHARKRLTIETNINNRLRGSNSRNALDQFDSPLQSQNSASGSSITGAPHPGWGSSSSSPLPTSMADKRVCSFQMFDRQVSLQMNDDAIKLRKGFLSMFVTLFSSYRSYVKLPQSESALRECDAMIGDGRHISLFDETAFEKDLKDDYKAFVSGFIRCQMFQMFIEERVQVEEPDWFEQRCLHAAQKKMAANDKNRRALIRGVFYKQGSRIPTWKERYFELDKMIIRYYKRSNKLLALVTELEELTSLSQAATDEEKESLFVSINEVASKLSAVKTQKRQGYVHLQVGRTRCFIPDDPGWSEPTDFPFVVRVYTNIDRDKVQRELRCCANTVDERREWIRKINARIAPIYVPFSRYKVAELLQKRLQSVREKHYLDQNKSLLKAQEASTEKFLMFSRKLFGIT